MVKRLSVYFQTNRKGLNELLEPELVHRWPCLPSEIALFRARTHTQSKGSGVGNDRFSLYPLHCSHPAHMKNTVQIQPLIMLWIRTIAVQEPDCHFTTCIYIYIYSLSHIDHFNIFIVIFPFGAWQLITSFLYCIKKNLKPLGSKEKKKVIQHTLHFFFK